MMKKNQKLTDMTLDELQQKQKQAQFVLIGLGLPMLTAFIALCCLAIVKQNYALIAVAISYAIAFLPAVINLGKINMELKSRL